MQAVRHVSIPETGSLYTPIIPTSSSINNSIPIITVAIVVHLVAVLATRPPHQPLLLFSVCPRSKVVEASLSLTVPLEAVRPTQHISPWFPLLLSPLLSAAQIQHITNGVIIKTNILQMIHPNPQHQQQ
jgi:hypothetical protein